jgi:hypothetical protein
MGNMIEVSVVLAPGSDPVAVESELNAIYSGELSDFETPSAITFLTTVPINDSLKK